MNCWREHIRKPGLVVLLIFALPAARDALAFERTVEFKSTQVYSLPAGLTPEEATIAVKLGLIDRKWTYQKGENGTLIAMLEKSNAMITLRVEHSVSEFKLHYIESAGLEYDLVTIHKSYKRWLDSLASDIQVEARRILVKKGKL